MLCGFPEGVVSVLIRKSLCSKSYIIKDQDGGQKISCKSISKKLTDVIAEFSYTLKTGDICYPTNLGFRMRETDMFTYSQNKICFNNFYCKREVLDDRISTRPLKLHSHHGTLIAKWCQRFRIPYLIYIIVP